MGHTMIGFAGAWKPFHDCDLWAIRHFLLLEASARASATRDPGIVEILSFLQEWDWLGPGVWLGVDLEEFIERSPSCRELLVGVIIAGKKRIEAFGDAIPLDYLRQNLSRSDLSFSASYPTNLLTESLVALLRLLNKKKKPNQSLQPTPIPPGELGKSFSI
jgi:hypothetical protein